MIAADVSFYEVLNFFHILAVVLALGPTFAYPVFLRIAESTDPRALPAVGRGIAAWEKIGTPLLVVILGAGIWMVIDDDRWGFGDFYVSWGIAVVVVLGALSGLFFAPKGRQLTELAERDIAASGDGPVKLSEEFQALNRQIGIAGTFAGLLVVVTIYFMTAKPFL